MKKLSKEKILKLNDEKCKKLYEFNDPDWEFDNFDIWQREEYFIVSCEDGPYGLFESMCEAFEFCITRMAKDIKKYRDLHQRVINLLNKGA